MADHDRLLERAGEFIVNALERFSLPTDRIDCWDIALTLAPGPQLLAIVYVAVKGPLLGATTGATELIGDLGALSSQEVIDQIVHRCLETCRAERAKGLVLVSG